MCSRWFNNSFQFALRSLGSVISADVTGIGRGVKNYQEMLSLVDRSLILISSTIKKKPLGLRDLWRICELIL